MSSYLQSASKITIFFYSVISLFTGLFNKPPATPTPIPINITPITQATITPNITTAHNAQSPTTTPMPSWKWFTEQKVTFQYPPLWKLEKNPDAGLYEVQYMSTYPLGKHTLPIFKVEFYNRYNYRLGQDWTLEELAFSRGTREYISVDNHRALRSADVIPASQGPSSEHVIIDIPEHSLIVVIAYLDSQYGSYDEEIELYMQPIISSLRIAP